MAAEVGEVVGVQERHTLYDVSIAALVGGTDVYRRLAHEDVPAQVQFMRL